MEEIEQYSEDDLQKLSYRVLQQISKSLALPSNVKKVYLVQLIFAKMHKTQAEVTEIVERVKYERQILSQTHSSFAKRKRKKNMHLQAMEVSSTNDSEISPPSKWTVRRQNCHSPEMPHLSSVMHYQPHRSVSPKNTSDRVLRSYNVKSYRRPNYSLINNSVIGLVKAAERPSSPKEKATQINIFSHQGKHQRLSLTAKCVVKKYQPSYEISSSALVKVEAVPKSTQTSQALVPYKRKRSISEIRSINRDQPLDNNKEYIQAIGFRRTDGKISRINALVQKTTPKASSQCTQESINTPTTTSYKNVEVTIQDIINSNIDAQTLTNTTTSDYKSSDYTEDSGALCCYQSTPLTDVMPSQIEESESNCCTLYYHKIDVEQDSGRRALPGPLPSLRAAFRPPAADFYDTYLADPYYSCKSTPVLEALYTLRAPAAPPAPLARPNPAATTCVYATTLVVCAVQQDLTPTGAGFAHNRSHQVDSEYQQFAATTSDEVSRTRDLMTFEQDMTLRRYHEAQSRCESSPRPDASQDLNASIPEMVEDALEIISQDGDYMERLGMDLRMQCVLCSWAGAKIMLEFHIRKEHESQVSQQTKSEWNVTYKLGAVVNQPVWLSHVSECAGAPPLYILSVRYQDPDCFMASLSTLSSEYEQKVGTLTIYNKITGEPYSWHGQIQELYPNMPYENDPNCLKIELSKLELLPNSANLKLLNRSLVLNSPSKVVIGQPELNDIHIIIFVKIEDALF